MLEAIAAHAEQWAHEVAKIHLSYFRSDRLGIETKSSIHDVVTRCDKESEAFLVQKITEHYPTHRILGEESGVHSGIGTGEYRWVIDPLDGTNNFSQGLPIFCVSIGVEYRGERVVGVVFTPYLNEMFTAIKGKGAYFNGTRLHIASKTTLNQSVLATGFPYDKDVNPDNNSDNIARIIPHLRGLRRMGAAAYDLCCVAAGWLDGFWEFNLQPWDVAAALLIIEEAGGVFEHFRQDRGIAIITANPMLMPEIKKYIK